MKRIPIPKNIQADVLFMADHTCSICGDTNKNVQIAHIDNNPSNNNEENLITLCLVHHDKVHSKSIMTKNYTELELKQYKANWETIVKAKRKTLENPSSIRLIRFDGQDKGTIYLETSISTLRAFRDPLTFELLGFNWGNVDVFPEHDKGKFTFEKPLKEINKCEKIRLKFADGTLANEIYIIWEDGRKHHVPDTETLGEIGGFEDIQEVNLKDFNIIPHGQQLLDIFTVRTKELLKDTFKQMSNK